jgi:hypothetical protein
MHDSPVMMSSTKPSAKYSCSGSPDMFWNGSTAMDGLSGSGSGAVASAAWVAACCRPWPHSTLSPPLPSFSAP